MCYLLLNLTLVLLLKYDEKVCTLIVIWQKHVYVKVASLCV